MQMSERFDRTPLNDPRGGWREEEGRVGEIRFEPIAQPRPVVSIGGGGAGRAGREGSALFRSKHPARSPLSSRLVSDRNLEGARVNARSFLLYATQLEPTPPLLEQPFREISFQCYSNEGPFRKGKVAPRNAYALISIILRSLLSFSSSFPRQRFFFFLFFFFTSDSKPFRLYLVSSFPLRSRNRTENFGSVEAKVKIASGVDERR